MYKKSLAFHQRQQSGKPEIVICRLTNTTGLRIFSAQLPPDNILMQTEFAIHDGTYKYDGAISYGDGYEAILDFGGCVLSWGNLQETLSPDAGDLILSLRSQEVTTLSIDLNNVDKYFSKLLGRENLLSALVEVLVGFSDIARNEFLEQFSGRVQKVSLTNEKVNLSLRAI